MTNAEFYRHEIRGEYRNFCSEFIVPNVLKPAKIDCGDIKCAQCHMIKAVWLLEEHKEPEIDWENVMGQRSDRRVVGGGERMKHDPYSLLGEIVTCEVQVTLRSGDHIGHVWFKHMGDRTELSAFGFDFKDIDHEDDIPHNDCGLSYSERFDGFCVELKNDKGDIESIKEESAGFLNSLVTSIEITDCYKEKSCYTCEEWEPGFERCRHPDQPQSLADDYMAPRDHCCDLWIAKGKAAG